MNLSREFYNKNMFSVEKLDKIAFKKDNCFETETTKWIFEDGSAVELNSYNEFSIIDENGLNADDIQINGIIYP